MSHLDPALVAFLCASIALSPALVFWAVVNFLDGRDEVDL